MLDDISPVDVSTLQDRVYQSLKNALLRGRFQPSEVLSIRPLAKIIGTSPMPVRDALNRLVAEKALIQTTNRQIRVPPFTPEIHEEHIRIRIHVEGLAAQRACRKKDPSLAERLTVLNQAMLAATKNFDIEGAVDANHQFHFLLYEAAEYPQLIDIISTLWLRTGPFVATAQRKPKDAHQLFETGFRIHQRIIDAVLRGDGRAARLALGADIRTATIWLRRNYEFEAVATNPALQLRS